jgi:hypothetical protein
MTSLFFLVPSLIAGARIDGIDGAATAALLVNGAVGTVVFVAMMRLLGARAQEIRDAVWRPAVGWVLMSTSILMLRPFVDELPPAPQLVILIAVGAGVYALSVAVLARDQVATMWVSLRGARTQV